MGVERNPGGVLWVGVCLVFGGGGGGVMKITFLYSYIFTPFHK